MRRSTWIVLVVFLALVGLTLFLNKKEPPADATAVTPTALVEYLFNEADGLPTSIDIKGKTGEEVAIERNQAGEWVLKRPIETGADQASSEAAATQLTALRVLSRPEVAPNDAGLAQPSYVMTVKLTGGMEKVVRIGDLTPTSSGYYVSFNESNEVLVVDKTGLDALLTLVTSPPYVSTPTPAPTP
jgi:Domain of unknown function (DUF4340)